VPILRQCRDAQVWMKPQWHAEVSVQKVRSQDYTKFKVDSAYPPDTPERTTTSCSSQRKAARILQVSGQSVGRWVKKYVDSLPAQPPKPATSEVTELDELHTFVQTNVI
jgi:hypothetical protein